MDHDIVILFEHPEWQKPLFEALRRRGTRFTTVDLKAGSFSDSELPIAPVYFNQASPSAYLRGNVRAVPFALSLMRSLACKGARVINGADVFALELSKSAQASLLRGLNIGTPNSVTFNDVGALRARNDLRFPALLKPEQGGSGARIELIEDLSALERHIESHPEIWLPDNLLLLQEFVPYDPEHGIVRMEFVGGELLYSMRVVTHGRYNLCPSPACNPDRDTLASSCGGISAAPPVEFHPFEAPKSAVESGKRILAAAGIEIGGIEYLDGLDGRRVFYDINANSNLRPSIGDYFGIKPYEKVVDYLEKVIYDVIKQAA